MKHPEHEYLPIDTKPLLLMEQSLTKQYLVTRTNPDRTTRTLAVYTRGSDKHTPVFLLHGTPGCGSLPLPHSSILYRAGIYLISYERPGYGDSDRHPERTVADAAPDLETVADALGIDEFFVVGRSGGGPHALACAASATLRSRIRGVCVLGGLSPQLETEGMSEENSNAFGSEEPDLSWISPIGDKIRAGLIFSLLHHLEPSLQRADFQVINNSGLRMLLAHSHAEALKNGDDGWKDDIHAIRRRNPQSNTLDWGFDIHDIPPSIPVLLRYGGQDPFTPVANGHSLRRQILHSELIVDETGSHFTDFDTLIQMAHKLIKMAR